MILMYNIQYLFILKRELALLFNETYICIWLQYIQIFTSALNYLIQIQSRLY